MESIKNFKMLLDRTMFQGKHMHLKQNVGDFEKGL